MRDYVSWRSVAFITPTAVRSSISCAPQRRAVVGSASSKCSLSAPSGHTRLLLLTVASAAAIVLAQTDSAHAYGLLDGRLEKCRGDLACISTTSVGNPSKFGAPWSYRPETDDADKAWTSLKQVLGTGKDGGRIVESRDGPQVYYLRAEFPSPFRGTDDVEFTLIKDEALVTYRSASREAFFLYPLQTPINFDKNKSRLSDIRLRLGWEEFAGFNVFGVDKFAD